MKLTKMWAKRTQVLDEVKSQVELIEDQESEEVKDANELMEELQKDYESHWNNGYLWGALGGIAATYMIMKNKKDKD